MEIQNPEKGKNRFVSLQTGRLLTILFKGAWITAG